MNSLNLNFQEGLLPSLHPHTMMQYIRAISIGKSLYESLTRLDAQGKPQLAGAEFVEVSPDGLHYTFILRENKWSDETPVTAYQYERAWKEALSPTSNCARADLMYLIKNAEQIKKGELPLDAIGVKAIDDKTLTIELIYPSPYLLELLALPIFAPLFDIKHKEPITFNGPFMVDSWQHGDYLRLKRNPYYWDRENISLEQIDIYMIQDSMTAYSMFEKGKIDWVGAPLVPLSAEIVGHLEKKKALKSHSVIRPYWLFLNTQHPSLSSPSIRHALSLAINRDEITNHLLIGSYPLRKPCPLALDPHTPTINLEENLEEAQRQFELGLKELRMTRKTFPPLVITYSQQTGRKLLAEYLQQAWSKAFDIKVILEPQEWNVMRNNLQNGNFQVSGCFEGALYSDPIGILDRFTTKNTSNYPKWENRNFKEKIGRAKREPNLEVRMKYLAEAENILMEELPFIPIGSDKYLYAHHPNLKGYIFDFGGACDFSRATLKSK